MKYSLAAAGGLGLERGHTHTGGALCHDRAGCGILGVNWLSSCVSRATILIPAVSSFSPRAQQGSRPF